MFGARARTVNLVYVRFRFFLSEDGSAKQRCLNDDVSRLVFLVCKRRSLATSRPDARHLFESR